MAVYPCSIGEHRYAGQQQSVYLSVLEGRDVASVKFRLCPTHFHNMARQIQDTMDNVSDGGQMSMLCQKCGEPRLTTVFARIYAKGEEEALFSLDLCASCLEPWRDQLAFASGMALGSR